MLCVTLNEFEHCELYSVCRIAFVHLLKSKWDEKLTRTKVFRYKIDVPKERVLDTYLLQLNANRSFKRRTPEHIDDIKQPFDCNKFNFARVSELEILFNIKDDNSNIHSVLVNVSPISKYHSLLCPFLHKCLPQVVTAESLKVALEVMLAAKDRSLRIGFNSLCALASVNHLHYHLLVESAILPIEIWPCHHIKGPLYYLKDYTIPAFCFEVTTKDSLHQNVQDINKLLQHFLNNSIAHNILITMGDGVKKNSDKVIRALIWPRKSTSGVKQLMAFNVAVCEMSGWFPVYNERDFVSLQKEDLENELRKWKLDNFEQLCEDVQILY